MFYYKFDLYYENFDWFGSCKKEFYFPHGYVMLKIKYLLRIDTLFSKKNTIILNSLRMEVALHLYKNQKMFMKNYYPIYTTKIMKILI